MLLPNLSSSLLGPGCSRLGVHELALPSNVLLVVPDGDAGGPPTTLYIAEAVVGTTAVVVVDVALMATARTDL